MAQNCNIAAEIRECFSTSILLGSLDNPVVAREDCVPEQVAAEDDDDSDDYDYDSDDDDDDSDDDSDDDHSDDDDVGDQVVLVARTRPALDTLATQIEEEGGEAAVECCDMATTDQVTMPRVTIMENNILLQICPF